MRYELTDQEWTAIRPMLPNKPRGVPRVNDRRVLNGIFWVLRSGAPWRDVPDDLGPYTTCYNRFVRWRRAGVWTRIMTALAAAHDASVQMIDTSIVRVHQHGACIIRNRKQSMGRSRGGLTSKIHAVVDTNGLPIRLALTAGEAHDNRLADKLLSRLKSGSMLLADRGYDADWIRALAARKGALANIPPRCNRREPICFSPYLYRARNLVERFFNKIKHCRRVATRYDKLAANYLAFVQLASIRLWLRVNESTSLVAHGLRTLPDIGVDRLPRMADFALWAAACEPALWRPGTFHRAYEANRRVAIECILDADPVAACVREILAERSSWTGTAANLLHAGAERGADGISRERTGWPKNPRALAGRLRRAQTFLRVLGIDIAFGRGGRDGSRIIRMRAHSKVPSAPSAPSAFPDPSFEQARAAMDI